MIETQDKIIEAQAAANRSSEKNCSVTARSAVWDVEWDESADLEHRGPTCTIIIYFGSMLRNVTAMVKINVSTRSGRPSARPSPAVEDPRKYHTVEGNLWGRKGRFLYTVPPLSGVTKRRRSINLILEFLRYLVSEVGQRQPSAGLVYSTIYDEEWSLPSWWFPMAAQEASARQAWLGNLVVVWLTDASTYNHC